MTSRTASVGVIMHRTKARVLATHVQTLSWRTRLALILAAAATFLALGAASARAAPAEHHGWSGYDSSTLLQLSGTIQDVQYGNPHVMLTLVVPPEPEEDGSIVDEPALLTVVLAPPFRSESRGLAREMLAPGVDATVEGYLHRSDTTELRAERIRIGELSVELR